MVARMDTKTDVIVGAMAFEDNVYGGHTIDFVLKKSCLGNIFKQLL